MGNRDLHKVSVVADIWDGKLEPHAPNKVQPEFKVQLVQDNWIHKTDQTHSWPVLFLSLLYMGNEADTQDRKLEFPC